MFFNVGVLRFCNIYRKTPVLESLFNKVAGLQAFETAASLAVFQIRKYFSSKLGPPVLFHVIFAVCYIHWCVFAAMKDYQLHYLANIYLFKINNRKTRTRWEICSKLTVKTRVWRLWSRSAVFIVNFKHVSNLFLLFLWLKLSR